MTIAEHVSGYPSYIIPPILPPVPCLFCPNSSIYPPLRVVSHIPAPAWCVPAWCPCVWMCKVGHMTGVGAAVWPATSPAAAHHRTTQPVRFKLHLDSAAWLPSLPSHSSLYLLSTIYWAPNIALERYRETLAPSWPRLQPRNLQQSPLYGFVA